MVRLSVCHMADCEASDSQRWSVQHGRITKCDGFPIQSTHDNRDPTYSAATLVQVSAQLVHSTSFTGPDVACEIYSWMAIAACRTTISVLRPPPLKSPFLSRIMTVSTCNILPQPPHAILAGTKDDQRHHVVSCISITMSRHPQLASWHSKIHGCEDV